MTKKIVTMGVTAIATLSLAACGSSSSSSSKPADKTSSSQKVDDGKMTLADFNAVGLGDVAKNGAGGATKDELTKKWGKPISSSSSTFQNIKTELLTWNKVANGDITANFTVQIDNGHTVQKAIQGIKVSRAKKITLADFNSIQNGQKEADITAKFGKPNGYSMNQLNGMITKELTYTSGIKGQLGANFSVTLQGDKVTMKTQSEME